MNDLVYLKNEQALTDSLTVAEMFGKEHAKVMRSIDNLVETLAKNGERSMFILTRRKADDGQFHNKQIYKDCKERMETVKAWTAMEGIGA